jgi:hypothetical protein
MSDDGALFDADIYGEATTKRRRKMKDPSDDVEPIVPPWVLLANRGGVIGFHVPKAPPDHYAVVHALCGVKGHVVVPPEKMVRCLDCEIRRTTES